MWEERLFELVGERVKRQPQAPKFPVFPDASAHALEPQHPLQGERDLAELD